MYQHFVSRFYLNLFECEEINKHIYRMVLPELRIDSKPKSTRKECMIDNYNTETQETQSNMLFEDHQAKEVYRLIEEVEDSKSSHDLVEDSIIAHFICFLKANNPVFRKEIKSFIDSGLYIYDNTDGAHQRVSLRYSDSGFKITTMFTELMMKYFSTWKFIIAYNPEENVRLITSDNPVVFFNPENCNESVDFRFLFGLSDKIKSDLSIEMHVKDFEFIQKPIVYFPLTPDICVSGYPDWDYFEEHGRKNSLPEVFNELVFLHANNRLYSSQRSILVDIRNKVLNSGKYNYDKDIVKKEYGSE